MQKATIDVNIAVTTRVVSLMLKPAIGLTRTSSADVLSFEATTNRPSWSLTTSGVPTPETTDAEQISTAHLLLYHT